MAIATGLQALAADILAIADAMEEFACPYSGSDPSSTPGFLINAGGEEAEMRLLVPQNFTAESAIEVIFTPVATGADMHITIATNWGAYDGGEAWDVHSENEANRDIGATVAAQNLAHDISDLVDVAALAKGDLLHVRVVYSATVVATNLRVMDLRLKYT